MSEWLDVMLEEIARKAAEAEAAQKEHVSREHEGLTPAGRASTSE